MMHFRVLGVLEVWAGERRVPLPESRYQRVLAALLLAPNSVVPMARLIAATWDDNPPATATKQIQNCVSALRERFSSKNTIIVTDGPGYRAVVTDDDLDALRFERELTAARRRASEGDLANAVELVRGALMLWRGPAFDGLESHALAGQIARLDEQRIRAVELCVDWLLELGEHQAAMDQLTDTIAEHPLRERLHAQLMIALDRSGREVDALAVFHELRVRMADELGLDPGSELQALHGDILARIPATDDQPAPVAGTPPARVDLAATHLATAVTRQWTAEAELRSLNRPGPVLLTWSSTNRPVSPAATATARHRNRSEQPSLGGNLADVVDTFRRIPTRQLVVLGEPGAGKTVLAIQLTLGLLADPQPDEPIPVLLPLASWNPHQHHLYQWLADKLLDEYPGLGNTAQYGRDAATRLVLDGKIIPILDGLDELPPEHHASAINAVDHAVARGRPVVVTCRATEYETAVRQNGAILTRAVVIEIEPVELDTALTFLRSRAVAGDARWKLVETYLLSHRDAPLAHALSTPLMIDLASTAYAHPSTNPAELCDSTRYPDSATIEDHLLGRYLPASYADRPTSPAWHHRTAPSRKYTPAQAERWLTFIARSLQHQQTLDIAWWRLHRAVPRHISSLYLSMAPGLFFMMTGWVAAGPVMGLIYGASFVIAGFIAHRFGRHADPLHVEFQLNQSIARFLLRFATGAAIGFAFGLGWVLPIKFMILLAVVFGVAMGVHVWLDVPVKAERVSTPDTALHNDRTATGAYTLSFAISLGLFYGIAFAFTPGNRFTKAWAGLFDPIPAVAAGISGALIGYFVLRAVGGIAYGTAGFAVGGQVFPVTGGTQAVATGILFGLAIGLTVCVARAWGNYTLTRLWLALRGELPFDLMHFLEDAHRRGVLRQAGPVYQFRHARLQARLASRDS